MFEATQQQETSRAFKRLFDNDLRDGGVKFPIPSMLTERSVPRAPQTRQHILRRVPLGPMPVGVAIASEKVHATPAHNGNEGTWVWFLSVKF